MILVSQESSSSSVAKYVNYLSKYNYKMLWISPRER